MIECPAQKVEPSEDYDSSVFPPKGRRGAQGLVSWGNCIKCTSNRGKNEDKLTIECGHNEKVVTLESAPL